jgi:chromosome segregation ATPase
MSCLTRCVFRWGLIGALGLGGLTLLVGPQRVAAGLAQVRTKAQGVVDQCMDDPTALRRQLEQLASEYPDRIREVTGEIAAVDHHLAVVTRDLEVARRSVAFATDDLGSLKTKIVKAEEAVQTRLASTGAESPVFIRFKGARFDLKGAYAEVVRIGTTRRTYQDRFAFDQEQFTMLQEQKARLEEVLAKLKEDHGTYQAQLWALDRQIDAIDRNDRLIELLEQQQATLANYDRYSNVASLDQIHARLAELRSTQEAQIETLRQHGVRDDYEQRARAEMEQSEVDSAQEILDQIMNDLDQAEPEVETSRSVAMLEPIIID